MGQVGRRAGVLLVLVAAACSSNSTTSSLSPTAAFERAVSTIAATQSLHVLVRSHTASGAEEVSDLIESPSGVSLTAIADGNKSEVVVVGNRAWERRALTGGAWTPLPESQVGSLLSSLNPGAEATCVRAQHGILRDLGTRTFAKQHTRALADDGSGRGGMKGTWYLTRSEPFRIVGFTGEGPGRTGAPPGCGSAGPGQFQRLYSYESAPPVTVPVGVSTP